MKAHTTILRMPMHEESTHVTPREVSITKEHHVTTSNTTGNNETAPDEGKKGTAKFKQKPC